jgi:hypothetical protein
MSSIVNTNSTFVSLTHVSGLRSFPDGSSGVDSESGGGVFRGIVITESYSRDSKSWVTLIKRYHASH